MFSKRVDQTECAQQIALYRLNGLAKQPINKLSIEQLIEFLILAKVAGLIPQLPELLFGENHLDPATDRILKKIAPILKQIGYKIFFEEIPEKEDEALKDTKIETKDLIPTYLTHLIININTISDLSAENKASDQKEIKLEKTLKDKNGESREAYYNCVRQLDDNGIEYKFVDKHDKDFISPISDFGIMLRDQHMAKYYLAEKRPVFGRVGLDHIPGMQKEFVNKDPDAKKLNKYICFHIYSALPLDQSCVQIRSGNVSAENFPLGITAIDASKMTENQIIKVILVKIIESFGLSYAKSKSHDLEAKSDCIKVEIKEYLKPAEKKFVRFSYVPNLEFGRTLEEETIIRQNLDKALDEKLITKKELNKLTYKIATIKYVFNNDFGLKGLREKIFTLKDMDGISPCVAESLMSEAGLSLMKKGFTPKQADALDFRLLKDILQFEMIQLASSKATTFHDSRSRDKVILLKPDELLTSDIKQESVNPKITMRV